MYFLSQNITMFDTFENKNTALANFLGKPLLQLCSLVD